MTDKPASIEDLEKCLANGTDPRLLEELTDRVIAAKISVEHGGPYPEALSIIKNLSKLDILSIRDLIIKVAADRHYYGAVSGPLPIIDFGERDCSYVQYGQALEEAYVLGDNGFRLKIIKSVAEVLKQLKASEPTERPFPLHFYQRISDFIWGCRISKFMAPEIVEIIDAGKFKGIQRVENGIDAAAMLAIPLYGLPAPSQDWWNSKFGSVPACTVFYGLWDHPEIDRSQLLYRLGEFIEKGLTHEQLSDILHVKTCHEFSEQIQAGLNTIKDPNKKREFVFELNKKLQAYLRLFV